MISLVFSLQSLDPPLQQTILAFLLRWSSPTLCTVECSTDVPLLLLQLSEEHPQIRVAYTDGRIPTIVKT